MKLFPFGILASPRSTLTAGLVGWWKMDEASGTTANDSSSSGINGTLSGGAAFAAGGRIARCLDLDGTGKCTVSDPYSTLVSNADKTVALWVFKETAVNGQETRMVSIFRGITGEGDGQTSFTISAGGVTQVLRYRYWNGTGLSDLGGSVTGASILNEWHHLALVQSGTSITAYLDGDVLDSANNAATTTPVSPPNAVIGGYNTSAEAFTGLIDDVRIYNRALAPAEIAALFAMG